MTAPTAAEGNTVEVHYTGRLDSGEVFDSSEGREPISFTIGSNAVIPGFDQGVRGLAVGEGRSVRIESSDAYGERDEAMVLGVPKADAPEGLTPGTRVMLGDHQAVVIDITDDHVVVDANHPLAGQALTFDLELVSIS